MSDVGRDWRDPRWTSARAVAGGLDSSTRQQRRLLMGENIIDIASKSVIGLLLDEVRLFMPASEVIKTNPSGTSPLLRFSNCFDRTLVRR